MHSQLAQLTKKITQRYSIALQFTMPNHFDGPLDCQQSLRLSKLSYTAMSKNTDLSNFCSCLLYCIDLLQHLHITRAFFNNLLGPLKSPDGMAKYTDYQFSMGANVISLSLLLFSVPSQINRVVASILITDLQ